MGFRGPEARLKRARVSLIGCLGAQAMGLSGISKSQVSKLCKEIDERVKAFLERPLDGDWPYLWPESRQLWR